MQRKHSVPMNDLFLERSRQNLQAVELLWDAALYDASANRSYYAVFDAAFVACLHFGVPIVPDHAKVLSAFCNDLIARRKVFPAFMKKELYDLQQQRIRADYGNAAVSKYIAQTSLKTAKNLVSTILEKVQP
ncbi:MAG: HEPN domain-containing protein [Candidatus Kapabacteria bacterium]|nr:HEPN domain-containing protein [Candidatus Kapabacteria bacterium]